MKEKAQLPSNHFGSKDRVFILLFFILYGSIDKLVHLKNHFS